MSATNNGFLITLFKILDILEIIALAGTLVGAIMWNQQVNGAPEILMISLGILAAVYFYGAFKPPVDSNAKSETPLDFFDLLYGVIVPKLVSIASAVAITGVLFKILQLKGSQEMLMIGVSCLVVCGLIFGTYKFSRSESQVPTHPIYYRLAPILIISAYFFLYA